MLQDAGHDASTVLEQGLSGASDRSLIDLRRGEGRCLVTLDIGFANALSFNPRTTRGSWSCGSLPGRSPPISTARC
ncbi:MAG: DUF5615 family PIN-like protein [Dehalococcoidia bacterium]